MTDSGAGHFSLAGEGRVGDDDDETENEKTPGEEFVPRYEIRIVTEGKSWEMRQT